MVIAEDSTIYTLTTLLDALSYVTFVAPPLSLDEMVLPAVHMYLRAQRTIKALFFGTTMTLKMLVDGDPYQEQLAFSSFM